MQQYVVLQVVLKEKFIGTGSGNLSELEKVVNAQASKGYMNIPVRRSRSSGETETACPELGTAIK